MDKYEILASCLRLLDQLPPHDKQWVSDRLTTFEQPTLAPGPIEAPLTDHPVLDYRKAISMNKPLWQNVILALAYLSHRSGQGFEASDINAVISPVRGSDANITNAVVPAIDHGYASQFRKNSRRYIYYLTLKGLSFADELCGAN